MRRILCLLLMVAIIIISGGAAFGSEVILRQAWGYYLRGDYNKAVNACRKIARRGLMGEEGRYIMGLSFLNLGDFEEARKNFSFALENYPKVKKREELLTGIADSYYLQKNFKEAAGYYIRVLRGFSGTHNASVIYLHLGECQRKLGEWQKARSSFYKIVSDFPLSMEAETARSYLKKNVDYFSVQAGAFSKKANAANLSKALKRKGYDAYIKKSRKNDRIIYRVKVGKFNTRREAEEEASGLRGKGFSAQVSS